MSGHYGNEYVFRGDAPCGDCGTQDNLVWFTWNTFWNEVTERTGGADILCIPCFAKRAASAGFRCSWQLLPDWPWAEKEVQR